MNMRQIALAGGLLAIVFIAHWAGRFTQIGGAQVALSIAFYILIALLLAPHLSWGPLVGIGLAVGVLTMLATSSPFPIANIPGHGIAFLLASALAKWVYGRKGGFSVLDTIWILVVVTLVSWTIFASVTWWGLAGTGFATASRERFGINFGSGLVAWWPYGFVVIGIPSMVISAILLPLVYRAVEPALVRQGMLPAPRTTATGTI